MEAYRRCELVGEIVSVMRPSPVPVGKVPPPVESVQVVPPLVVTYRPLAALPDGKPCPAAAYRCKSLVGSMTTSDQGTVLENPEAAVVLVHVVPPSVDFQIPVFPVRPFTPACPTAT